MLEHKKQLLKALLEKKAATLVASAGQNALWAFSLLYPNSSAYHLKFTARLTPSIKKEDLENALISLIDRHPVFHSHFLIKEGVLYQHFNTSVDFSLEEKQVSKENSMQVVLEDYIKPFDLKKGPLIRAVLYDLPSQEQIFLLVIHHIVIDGLSLLHLIDELGQILKEKQDSWQAPAYDFRHYLNYQQKLPQLPVYAESLAYWQEQLNSVTGKLRLPYDEIRKSRPTYEGGAVACHLSSQQVKALRIAAGALKMTAHAFLLSIYQLWLHSLCEQKKLVSATPCLGRDKKEFLPIIGYCANLVVIKSEIDAQESLSSFLKRTSVTLVEALQHQQIPFSVLVKTLKLDTEPYQLPLAQAAFAFHQPFASSQGLGLDLYSKKTELFWNKTRVEAYKIPPTACQFDLYLVALEQGDGSIDLSFEYMKDVFHEESITLFAAHFINLLDAAVKDTKQKITDFPLYKVRAQLVQEIQHYNATQKIMPTSTVTELCELSLKTHAQLIAVIDETGEYTYKILDQLSHNLASLLPQTKPQAIGILLPKGVEQIIAVLAVLWRGHYFVPINLDNPPERIKEIIAQAQMEYLISTPNLGFNYQIENVQIIDVNQAKSAKASNTKWILPEVSPEDLVYVIFTSGTTGVPKGVAISHSALLNTVLAINEQFSIDSKDCVFALSDLSFDLAMYDVFGTLLAGSSMILCPQNQSKEPKNWLYWLKKYPVSVWNTVPMLFSMLLKQSREPLPLKKVFLSGDWISVDLIEQGHELCPQAELVSLGGPTETTIWSIHYPLKRNTPYSFIPYGYPLPNHQYYVLDEDLKLCAYEQVGELYVGGMGLAQGYLKDQELTNKVFFMHPLYGRLYRSGDLGVMTRDFGVRIKGRSDRQVKIGGYRIELDDVRLALEQSFTGMTITCHASGEVPHKRLIAYLQDPEAKTNSLIADVATEFPSAYLRLKELLPVYMVPEIFLRMKKLPLSKNNKVNYQALPSLEELLPSSSEEICEPTQKKIAAIWAEVLQIPIKQISSQSHFFQLGGDSLSAVSVIHAVDKIFQVACNLNILFDAPILSAFAKQIAALPTNFEEQLPSFEANPKQRFLPFALTPVQQAYWIGRQNQMALGGVSSHSYYELDVPKIDVPRFQRALDATIARHDMLRMVINKEGMQEIMQTVPAYPLQVVLTDLEAKLAQAREAYSHEVLAMSAFPSFRIILFQYEDKSRVLISYDALQFDAWSFLIFLAELSKHYNHPGQLEATSINFSDYVLYLQKLSKTSTYQKAENYWAKRIPHLPKGPQLAVSPIKNATVFNRLSGTLPKVKWDRLVAKAKDRSCTATCLVLSAFAWVIAQYSRQPHFCLNLTLFNRPPFHEDIEKIIGDFTSLILLEVYKRGNSFAAFMHQMQTQLIQDLDHRWYEGIQVQRDMRRLHTEKSDLIAPVVFTSTLGFKKPALLVSQKEVRIHYSITQTPQVWLDNQIREDEEGLHWVWDYLEGLFEEDTIKAMEQQFTLMLHALVEADWECFKPRALLSEQKQNLLEFNATQKELPQITLTQALIQKESSEAIAVLDNQGELSYQQLIMEAKKLAGTLRDYPPGSAVAILLEKGRDQVIACLAILFAGHYFVPLNLANPKNRLHLLLKESRAVVLITSSELIQKHKISNVPLIDVQTREQPLSAIANPNLKDLAYVIYTSGSTGIPKGVAISHQSLMNTLLDINQRFAINSLDKVLALSDLSFDLSLYDIFGLLLAGGCLVFPEQELVKEPQHWLDLIKKHQISIWNTVPMLFAMLLQAEELLPSLKTVLLSGDWIRPDLVTKGFSLCPNAKLLALGGATECSIWSNYYVLKSNTAYDYIPYGYPLSNQTFWVLHQDLSLCPVGVEGELYIGGLGLAQGYFGEPEKTAKAFILHPELGLLYRTGDWGVMTKTQGLKFLGRQDSQVKIGGYRIELNEVESNLRRCLGINELLVHVQNNRLLAYLVWNKDKIIQKLEQKNIRQFAEPIPAIKLPHSANNRLWFMRKSYRQWIRGQLSAADIQSIIESIPQSHPKSETLWISALESLKAVHTKESSLAKRRYPSAGGLYPVQCYLSLTQDPAGCYYYDPEQHALIQLSKEPMHEVDELFLIADRNLIQPHYPANWHAFCELEAGHMAALLSGHVDLQSCDSSIDKDLLQLAEYQILLAQFQFGRISSDMRSCWVQTTYKSRLGLDPTKRAKRLPNQLKDEEFCPQAGTWSLVMDKKQVSSPGINQKIVSEAQAFIFFDSSFSNFAKGWYAQKWMEALAQNNIGSCYIASLQYQAKTQLGIALGKVSSTMRDSQTISQNEPSQQELIHQAYALLQTELPDYLIPKEFILLTELPLNANGKIDKTRLPSKKALLTTNQNQPIEDSFELKIATIWSKVLQIPEKDLYQDSDFFSLGGDSLKALELLSLLKNERGIQLDLKIIFKASTLSDFCAELRLTHINQLVEAPAWISLNPGTSTQPLLILIHPGTGTIDCYLSFVEGLEVNYEVWAVQYKNSGAKNLYELAAEYAQYLMFHYPHRIIHLLGYSLGAYIAFEMAKILDAHQVVYKSLALVDALPINSSEEIYYETEGEKNLFEQVLLEDYQIPQDKLHLFLSYIYDRQNALLSLCENYITEGNVAGPILYFKAKEETAYLKKQNSLEKTSWNNHSNAELIETLIEGNHMNLFSQKHVAKLRESYLLILSNLIHIAKT